MIMHVIEHCTPQETAFGLYLHFADPSGAELYLQGNMNQELVGFNPHFAGKSRRRVRLTASITRDSSELDGGFHAWAAPGADHDGDYPFIFDVPDYRRSNVVNFPVDVDIQLTAFGSNDFAHFENEEAFYASQPQETKFDAKNFIPTGLFAAAESGDEVDLTAVRPVGSFAGTILEWEKRKNEISGQDFYWLLADTLGGPVDVVVDPRYVPTEPTTGGIVSGTFWLSGRFV